MISLPFFPRNAPLLPEACYFSTCLLTIDEVHVRHALDPRQGQSGMAHERAKNMQKQINELVYLDKPIPSFYPTRWQDLPGQMADLAIFCARGVQKAIR